MIFDPKNSLFKINYPRENISLNVVTKLLYSLKIFQVCSPSADKKTLFDLAPAGKRDVKSRQTAPTSYFLVD